jgi:hypothetical protein
VIECLTESHFVSVLNIELGLCVTSQARFLYIDTWLGGWGLVGGCLALSYCVPPPYVVAVGSVCVIPICKIHERFCIAK